jgi:hypothetical protein
MPFAEEMPLSPEEKSAIEAVWDRIVERGGI